MPVWLYLASGAKLAAALEDNGVAFAPSSCGSGDMVIVARVLENNAPNLWRLNMATGETKQLTFGKDEEIGSCTPDGKWMLYSGPAPGDNLYHIYKVSTDGGDPVEPGKGRVHEPAVSPDGQLVAYVRVDGQGASAKSKLVLQNLEGGPSVPEIEIPSAYARLNLGWTPDGHALTTCAIRLAIPRTSTCNHWLGASPCS